MTKRVTTSQFVHHLLYVSLKVKAQQIYFSLAESKLCIMKENLGSGPTNQTLFGVKSVKP